MKAVSPIPATAPAAWPLQTHLELAALPSAVPCARGHARSVALEWGLPGLADTTELLVSELMTNAVRASARLAASEPPVVRLWLISDRASIVIHVWDGSSEMPVRRDAGPDAERGRGLLLVDALGTDWGTTCGNSPGPLTAGPPSSTAPPSRKVIRMCAGGASAPTTSSGVRDHGAAWRAGGSPDQRFRRPARPAEAPVGGPDH